MTAEREVIELFTRAQAHIEMLRTQDTPEALREIADIEEMLTMMRTALKIAGMHGLFDATQLPDEV